MFPHAPKKPFWVCVCRSINSMLLVHRIALNNLKPSTAISYLRRQEIAMTLTPCRYPCVWMRWGTIFKCHSLDGCGREAAGGEDAPPERSCRLAVSLQEVSVVQM